MQVKKLGYGDLYGLWMTIESGPNKSTGLHRVLWKTKGGIIYWIIYAGQFGEKVIHMQTSFSEYAFLCTAYISIIFFAAVTVFKYWF